MRLVNCCRSATRDVNKSDLQGLERGQGPRVAGGEPGGSLSLQRKRRTGKWFQVPGKRSNSDRILDEQKQQRRQQQQESRRNYVKATGRGFCTGRGCRGVFGPVSSDRIHKVRSFLTSAMEASSRRRNGLAWSSRDFHFAPVALVFKRVCARAGAHGKVGFLGLGARACRGALCAGGCHFYPQTCQTCQTPAQSASCKACNRDGPSACGRVAGLTGPGVWALAAFASLNSDLSTLALPALPSLTAKIQGKNQGSSQGSLCACRARLVVCRSKGSSNADEKIVWLIILRF